MKKQVFLLMSLLLALFIVSCKNNDTVNIEDMTPSQLLSSTPWVTTGAKDSKGNEISLTDSNVINFVGYAYFRTNGSFAMYNLNDTPKLKGDWRISADGKIRTLDAKNNQEEVIFTRDVEILVLNKKEFTYRVYPSREDRSVYYDIIHTPTSHKESMMTPGEVLVFNAWETTGAVDQNRRPIDLTDPTVASFVGYAYYKTDNSFAIYGLNGALRIQGTWSVSEDGKTRTLVFENGQGERITRVVDITILTGTEFTYRYYPNESDKTVYYDIIHTPTSHIEPTR
ncbi:DUF4822 domain-containing protein [Elizabethkingia anophelis]|nr:DUF4822 domain-containing protein [Elizabethkingia anophelis]